MFKGNFCESGMVLLNVNGSPFNRPCNHGRTRGGGELGASATLWGGGTHLEVIYELIFYLNIFFFNSASKTLKICTVFRANKNNFCEKTLLLNKKERKN